MRSFNFVRWLRSWVQGRVKTIHKKPRYRVAFEQLEDRLAPAINSFIWDGGGGAGNTNWASGINWIGDTAPPVAPAAGDQTHLVFPVDPLNLIPKNTFNNFTNAFFNTITIDENGYTLAGNAITLGSASTPGTLLVQSGVGAGSTVSFDIKFGGTSGNQVFDLLSGAQLTVSGKLSGPNGVVLSKQDPGTLILSGDNSGITGAINISGGALQVRHANALGDTGPGFPGNETHDTTVQPGAQLQLNMAADTTFSENVRLNGLGTANNGALLNLSGNNTWLGKVLLDVQDPNDVAIGVADAADTLLIHGVVSDLGSGQGLIKDGPGKLHLVPLNSLVGNTYRGKTTVTGGMLAISHPFALGEGGTANNFTVVNNSLSQSGTLALDFLNHPQLQIANQYLNFAPTQTMTLTNVVANNSKIALSAGGADALPFTYTGNSATDAASIASALQSLSTIGGLGGSVSVTPVSTTVFTIVYGSNLMGMDLPVVSALISEGPGYASVAATTGSTPVGFKVPTELLTLNGFGMNGVYTQPRLRSTRTVGPVTGPPIDPDYTGALNNEAGQNSWNSTITFWTSDQDFLDLSGYGVAVTIGAKADTNLTINGVIEDDDPDVEGNYFFSKVGFGRVVLTNSNTFTASDVEILQGPLNIRDSNALGLGTNQDVWWGTTLELQADGIADSETSIRNASNAIAVPDYDLFYPDAENIDISGAGWANEGAIYNVTGHNKIAGTVTMQVNSSIGVAADNDPYNLQGRLWNDLSQLTIDGIIQDVGARNLTKVGLGELVLTNANTYRGRTFIDAGWATVRNNEALGVYRVGLGETAQPGTTVASGAALHLKQDQFSQSFVIDDATVGVTTFTLTFKGQTIAPVTYTGTVADAAIVEARLNLLPAIFNVGGSVHVLKIGNVFTITFQGTMTATYQPPFTASITEPASIAVTSELLNLTLFENLDLSGTGINHRFGWLDQQGAVENLGGENVLTGTIFLNGDPTIPNSNVHIGTELDGALNPNPPVSSLTTTGTIADLVRPTLSTSFYSSGTAAGERFLIETGAFSGTINISFDARTQPDNLRVYYPPRAQGGTILFETTLNGVGALPPIAYSGTSTFIEIVMNEGGGGTATEWYLTNVQIIPTTTNAVGGITKVGSQRLILQGEGTYTGDVNVRDGVVRVMNDTGLGTATTTGATTTTTVQAGASLELAPTTQETAGGVVAGLEVWNEKLVLLGTGNSDTGNAPLSILSQDNVWRGPISLRPSVAIAFEGALADTDFATLGSNIAGLTGTNPTLDLLTTTTGGNGVNAVQTLTFGGNITGGNFKLSTSEVQQVTLNSAIAGTTRFRLTFDGQTTQEIPYTGTFADNIAIQNALNALSSIGGAGGFVTVTGGGTNVFRITFGGNLAGLNQPQMTGTVTTPPGSIAISTLINSSTTGNIAWSPTPSVLAANIQAALDGLANVGAGNTEVTANSPIIDVFPNARFNATGVIDDAGSPMNSGSDLIIQGSGETGLAGNNTYRGTTYVNQGVLSITNGAALGSAGIADKQIVTLTGGTALTTKFKLTFKGSTTSTITYVGDATADANAIEAALNALPTIGGISGTATVVGSGSTFTITLGGNLIGFDQPKLTTTLVTGPGTLTVTTVTDGAGGTVIADGAQMLISGSITVAGEPLIVEGTGAVPQPEVQNVNVGNTTPGKPINGQFTLTFGGNTTDPLPFGASAAQVEAALNLLPTIAGFVKVYKTSPESYQLIYRGALGTTNQPQITSADGVSEVQIVTLTGATSGTTKFTLALNTISLNGNTINGNAVVTGISSTASLSAGMAVSGTGIPANTIIASKDSATQITLSRAATATGTNALRFGLTANSTQKTGNTTSGNPAVTMASTLGLVGGMRVMGAGIPAGATIAAVNSGTQITLSANATATASGVTLVFTTPFTYTGALTDAAAIEAALNALPTVGAAGGTATVNMDNPMPGVTTYRFILGGTLAGNNLPVVTFNVTTGPGTAAVNTLLNGAVATQNTTVQGGTAIDIPLRWFSMGPAPINNGQIAGNKPVTGRVSGVTVDPSDPDVIYVTAAGGGTWKTVNGGQTWTQLTDIYTEVPSEVQRITIEHEPGTSGTFNLTFDGSTIGTPLPYDATGPGTPTLPTATQVENALNALGTINGVGGSVNVTKTAGVDEEQVLVVLGATGGSTQISLSFEGDSTSVTFGRTSEVQTISLSGATASSNPNNATNFNLTDGNGTTADIPYTGNGATDRNAIDAALEGLFGNGTITVTGGGPGPNPTWTITWGGALSGQNIALLAGQITANSGTIAFNTIQEGGQGGNDAGNIENALNALPSIGGVGGSVSVTQAPGGDNTSGVFIIRFEGSLAERDVQPISAGVGAGSGGVRIIEVTPGRLPVFVVEFVETLKKTNVPEMTAAFVTGSGTPSVKTAIEGGTLPAQVLFSGAIAVAPNDPRIIYFGTGEGNNSTDSFYGSGVYKSIDSGRTWTLLTDLFIENPNPLERLAVNEIIVDPDDANLIYVATSDRASSGLTGSGSQNTFDAPNPGVWRYDGVSWFNLTNVVSEVRATEISGQPQPSAGGAFAYDNPPGTPGPDDNYVFDFPQRNASWTDITLIDSDPDFDGAGNQPPIPVRVLYATLGTSSGDVNNGVFRTYIPQFDNGDGLTDPSENRPIWYVGSVGDPNDSPFPAPDYRNGSTNGTFPNGFPSGSFTGGAARNGNIKTVVIEAPILNSTTLYAAITNPVNGALLEIQKSTNGGKTWAAVNFPVNYQGNAGFYNSTIVAFDAQTVYVGGRETNAGTHIEQIWQTTNGGASWTDITNINIPDAPRSNAHTMTLDSSGRLLVGTDGGLWRWDDATDRWSDLNGNLAITQFNSVGHHPTNPDIALGGSQSNGTERFTGDQPWTITDGIQSAPGVGDGGQVRFDPKNPAFAYHIRNGVLVRSTDGGLTWPTVISSSFGNNVSSFVVDSVNTSRLVAGTGAGVLESTNQGGSWTNLFAPIGGLVATATYQGNFTNTGFPFVTDLGANTYDPNTIYVTNGTSVRLTKNAHGPGAPTWVNRTPTLRPNTVISDMLVDPSNRDTVYVTTRDPWQGSILGASNNGPIVITSTVAHQLETGDEVEIRGVGGNTAANGTWTITKTSNFSFSLNGSLGNAPYTSGGTWTARVPGEGRVFKSTDAGLNWTDISTGLPDMPAWKIVIDPRTNDLYLGNDNGVWKLTGGTGGWERFGDALPNVQVKDLELNLNLNIISAGTYGRSMFQFYLDDVKVDSGAVRALSGTNIWTGPVILAGPTTITADGSPNVTAVVPAQLQIVGTVSDLVPNVTSYTLTKEGFGKLGLLGNNSYGGLTDIQEGIVVAGNPRALGKNPTNGGLNTIVTVGTALELQSDVELEPVQLFGNGFLFNGHFTGAMRNISGNNTFTGPITLMTNSTFGVDSGTTLTIGAKGGLGGTGSITDGGSNTFNVTKELTGTLVFASANTYDGLTAVNQGALRVQHASGLGSTISGTDVLDGAQIQMQGGITVTGEVLNLTGTGIVGTGAMFNTAGNNTWKGQVVLSTMPGFLPSSAPNAAVSFGVLDVDDTLTIDGVIDEAVPTGLLKVGLGTLLLKQANTYTGTTYASNGAITVQNNGALGALTNYPTGTITNVTGTSPIVVTSAGHGLETGATVTITGVLGKTGTNGTWTITVIDGDTFSLDGSNAPAAYTGGGTWLATPEVQRVTTLSPSGSGSFTLTYTDGTNTATTSSISFGAPATGAGSVQSALEALDGIPGVGDMIVPGDVAVTRTTLTIVSPTGTETAYLYTIRFLGKLAGVDQALMLATGTAGTTAFIGTVSDGGIGTNVAAGAALQLDPGSSGGSLSIPDEPLSLNGAGIAPDNDGALRSLQGTNTWQGPVSLATTSSIGVDAGKLTVLGTTSDPSNASGLNKVGPGRLVFKGLGSYNGASTVLDGDFQVDNTIISNVVLDGGSLGGIGTVGTISMASTSTTGTVNPGRNDIATNTGNLRSSTVTWNAGTTFFVNLTDTSNYDRLVLNTPLANLALTNATLDGAAGPGVAVGDSFTIITYTGVRSGTFTNAPTTGSFVFLGGAKFSINYDDANKQVIITRAPTSVTLDAVTSPNPSVYGQAFNITATLDPESGTMNGQTITFVLDPSGANISRTATVTNNVATISSTAFGVTYIGVGTHTFVVSLNEPGFSAASDTVSHTVNKASTATSNVTRPSDPSSTGFGTPVTFKATVSVVSPGQATASDLDALSVTFKDTFGGVTTNLGTVSVNAAGEAFFTTTATQLAVGTHSIKASLETNAKFNVSTSPAGLGHTVTKAASTTDLTTDDASSFFGQEVTFTATVSPAATGTVTFTSTVGSTTTTLGSVTLTGSVAVFKTTNLSVNSHTIKATYNGNANLAASNDTVAQTVVKANTTTVLTSATANPTVYGQPITFTATVTGDSPSTKKPTSGTVTFKDGATVLGTTNVNASGIATFTTTAAAPLSVGTHSTLTATYNGNATFNASPTSAALTRTVNKANTTTVLTAPAGPFVFGQDVTFTATVSPVAPGVVKPASGTVTFKDGAATLGTGTVNANGVATLTTSALSVGTHANLTAVYGGNGNFNASPTSAAISRTVNKAGTKTTVTSSNNPSVVGTSVTFSADVTVNSPGSGTVTGSHGTVTFRDTFGGTTSVLGNGTYNSGTGQWEFSTSSLAAGTHSITATFNSTSGNFNSSPASTALSQKVAIATTTTIQSASPSSPNSAQKVTFTAKVVGNPPGSPLPTGTITFKKGSTTLGTANVTQSTGIATFTTTSPFAAGSHTITATYNGDAKYNPSTSANFNLNVTQAPAVKLTATVSPSADMAPNALFTITAYARDSADQVVPNYNQTGTIKVQSQPSGATVTRNGTPMPIGAPVNITFSSGVATISDLKANLVGTYVFEITAPGLPNLLVTVTISTGGRVS